MVRHEAAEALGAIADDACIQLLQQYSTCEEPIVSDSCIVALDMIAHEKSGAFEYADLGQGS
jgi:deoxyhypusine monooxygenase